MIRRIALPIAGVVAGAVAIVGLTATAGYTHSPSESHNCSAS